MAAVMSREVISVADDTSLAAAGQLLERHGLGLVPVVNARATLVGLLRRADLPNLGRWHRDNISPQALAAWLETSVGSVMLTPIPSVAADAPLRRVASALLESGLAGLPVVDEAGLVIGIVSRSDVLQAVLSDTSLDLWG